jgi:hypothetical protein
VHLHSPYRTKKIPPLAGCVLLRLGAVSAVVAFLSAAATLLGLSLFAVGEDALKLCVDLISLVQ